MANDQQITLEKSYSFARSLLTKTGSFVLEFYWNNTGSYWYMNITDSQRVPIACGIKLIFGKDLLKGFRSAKTPDGEIYITSSVQTKSDPVFDNIEEFTITFLEY